jgi:hypothetical protein
MRTSQKEVRARYRGSCAQLLRGAPTALWGGVLAVTLGDALLLPVFNFIFEPTDSSAVFAAKLYRFWEIPSIDQPIQSGVSKGNLAEKSGLPENRLDHLGTVILLRGTMWDRVGAPMPYA